jgi:DNA-binding Lrp family transcriptional regulator
MGNNFGGGYMVFGYVLISTKNAYEHIVADKLSGLDVVVDVEPLIVEETAIADPFFEDYDLIAKIKANNYKNLKKIVSESIQSIQGVEKTKIASRSKI